MTLVIESEKVSENDVTQVIATQLGKQNGIEDVLATDGENGLQVRLSRVKLKQRTQEDLQISDKHA